MKWFFHVNGKQEGPLDVVSARDFAIHHPQALAWREGYAQWIPVKNIPELSETAVPSSSLPPTSPFTQAADEIDYKIIGSEMQLVEIELDPGESVIAEAGAMMYKQPEIDMTTIFGDGSKTQQGFLDKLLGAGKRLLTGESLFMTLFTHRGQGKATISFSAPYPGNIIPVNLKNMGGTLICQKDALLCAAKGVSIGIYFQRRILTGLFGGEGFIMEKLEGDGLAFLHAGGTIIERVLAPGEELHIDTGCIVAIEPSVDFDIRQAGNIKTMLFGGEGFVFASVRGPGKIWLQSLPFSRLAGRMLAAAPSHGGSRDEGSVIGRSVLGGSILGGLLNSDDDE